MVQYRQGCRLRLVVSRREPRLRAALGYRCALVRCRRTRRVQRASWPVAAVAPSHFTMLRLVLALAFTGAASATDVITVSGGSFTAP